MGSRGYREKALNYYGEKCTVCGDSEDVIHHRDGDSGNNEVSNLIPLCASCHQKIHAGIAIDSDLVQDLGMTPREGKKRTIQVSDELADELHDRKERGDSYEDVIWRLIKEKKMWEGFGAMEDVDGFREAVERHREEFDDDLSRRLEEIEEALSDES